MKGGFPQGGGAGGGGKGKSVSPKSKGDPGS